MRSIVSPKIRTVRQYNTTLVLTSVALGGERKKTYQCGVVHTAFWRVVVLAQIHGGDPSGVLKVHLLMREFRHSLRHQ